MQGAGCANSVALSADPSFRRAAARAPSSSREFYHQLGVTSASEAIDQQPGLGAVDLQAVRRTAAVR